MGPRKMFLRSRQTRLRKDNKEIDYRIKLLKMADKGSWSALERYAADPLYDDKEDYKKLESSLEGG